MANLSRTPEGKVVLFEVSTGTRLTRWPVDAKAMLAAGDFTTDPSQCDAVPVSDGGEQPVEDPTDETSIDLDTLNAQTGVPAGVEIPDPLPHLTEARKQVEMQSPTGAPLNVTTTKGAPAAAANTADKKGR